MQAEYAEELATIRDQARRFLENHATPEHLKLLLERPGNFDHDLWQGAVEQGWAGVAVPSEVDGLGLGQRGLGLLCEELGRATASLPLIANSLSVRALLQADAQLHSACIQALTTGDGIACLALADPDDGGLGCSASARAKDGRLSGSKALTAFANIADCALVQALDEQGSGLYLVYLDQTDVKRITVEGFDNARASAALSFDDVQATRLGGHEVLADITALAALATAFEQIGGAQACLELACNYARERKAFGQSIGGFQGIKHKLAEMYCQLEIARGCVSDALEAWEENLPSRQALAATARLGATRAYDYAAQESLHVHGGMGVTWEAMPHHFYRRSRSLALELGSLGYWRERLLCELGFASSTVLAG